MAVRDKVKEEKQVEMKLAEKPENLEMQEDSHSTVEVDENGNFEVKDTRSTRDAVKQAAKYANKNKPKPERFLWVKMWISYFLSMTMKDRGKIPDNIGGRLLITNNAYITKNYMSTIVQIIELGTNTPVTMMGVLNEQLREKGNKAVLDMTCKNEIYKFDPMNSGINSRKRMWENTLNSDIATRNMKERSARCLYTLEVAHQRVLKNTRMFITIRAKDINTLNGAEKIIYENLSNMDCTYLPSYSTVKDTLEYISIIGGRHNDVKSITPVMTSNVILSQLVANTGSYNDRKGYYVGMNLVNGSHYYIDFASITGARNIYVVAPSGVGKTVLALNIAQSAYEHDSACCFMDIKGNEYSNFIHATNGYIVSLRATSTEYINSWVMHAEDTTPELAEAYFKSRISFSKQQIIILSGIRDREQLLELEELLDEFHDSLYVSLGAIPSNMNSWVYTKNLNPYEIFRRLESYLTPQKRAQYNLPKSMMGTLRMYMSESGTKSYIFKQEFEYGKILASDTLSFDFGILANTSISDIDEDLFRLKFLYMSQLNGEFTTRKYAEGRRTLKILEESQVVSPEITKMYVQEYTLRRSQNQDTILLGNSVQALTDNVIAKPLIENTRGLFIGELTLDARNEVIEQFGLQHLQDLIMIPGSHPRYKNCFLFINKMQSKELYPIIQVQIEKGEDGKPRKYKVNTPVAEVSTMAGN